MEQTRTSNSCLWRSARLKSLLLPIILVSFPDDFPSWDYLRRWSLAMTRFGCGSWVHEFRCAGRSRGIMPPKRHRKALTSGRSGASCIGYCPPLSNSWMIIITWLYIAFNRTPNTDCYWVGAVPKSFTSVLELACVPVSYKGPVRSALARLCGAMLGNHYALLKQSRIL